MSDFTTAQVDVLVPATSANLGPGFDALGLALDAFDRLSAQVRPDGLEIEIVGEGAETLPRTERHLVVRAMESAFAALGLDRPGLWLRCENVIPQSRGMGSSSAAIVGGLVLARGLLADPGRLSDQDLLALATAIEGHPDNVAPALLGGFVVCGTDEDGTVWSASPTVDARLRAVVFVPPGGVSTEAARGLLPATVPHRDAAANSGRAALLVAALAGAEEHLFRATEDWLHQRYRAAAMPESAALVTQLRTDGVAAIISGAGPTVLALTVSAEQATALQARCPAGWSTAVHAVDRLGARVLDGPR